MVLEFREAPLSLVQDLNSPEQTSVQVCGCTGKKADPCMPSFHGDRSDIRWPESPALTPSQIEAPHKVLGCLHIGGRGRHQRVPPRLHVRPKEDQVEVVAWPHVPQDFKERLLGL